MIDATVIVALVAAIPVVFGGWLTYMAKKKDRESNREGRLEDRVDAMEKKLDKVQRYLRREQRFSHRLVLALTGVVDYIRRVTTYREKHREKLPEGLPDLPDIDHLTDLLDERPTYDDDDE